MKAGLQHMAHGGSIEELETGQAQEHEFRKGPVSSASIEDVILQETGRH